MWDQPKSPQSKENHLGIELEFCCKLSEPMLAQKLGDLVEYIQIKQDHSIRATDDYKYPIELVICIPQSRLDILDKIIDIIQPISYVNYSCGFHLHIDMRQRDPQKVYYNLYCAMPILYAMNPSNRYIGDGTSASGGGFAKKNEFKNLEEERQNKINKVRYKGINIESLAKHQTIEIRIHSGTINREKIRNWIEILLTVADTNMPRIFYNVKDFCDATGLNHLLGYIQTRIRKFNKDGYHLNVEENN